MHEYCLSHNHLYLSINYNCSVISFKPELQIPTLRCADCQNSHPYDTVGQQHHPQITNLNTELHAPVKYSLHTQGITSDKDLGQWVYLQFNSKH